MKNGFTLLELLLSSTLFVTLLGSVWGITSLYLRTETYAVQASERSRINRLVVRLLNDDIISALQKTLQQNTLQQKTSPQKNNALPPFSGSPQQLVFDALSPSGKETVTIIYEQRQGIGLHGSALIRQTQGAFQVPLQIVPEIIGCRFRYYDGVNWHDSWNSQKQNALPKAVESVYRIVPLQGAKPLWESVIIALP
ncbi:MAG: type II secretion system protein GspJ [Planctomycetaceae bacterium]|jgi:hypothetical protein|nr:type II secretion system protein GspJ [Planctomycetaceae bacterium]